MAKRKVLIAVHQLNIGGVQKALISALNAIDYNENDVTLYIRKDRVDLLPLVNKNVSKVIINKDPTKYYRKTYSALLLLKMKLAEIFHKDTTAIKKQLNEYVVSKQMKYEKKHYFADGTVYDVAISYIQSHTAKFVEESINANRKIMFYHGSTDEFHDINEAVMAKMDKVYCVSNGAMQAVKGFYPEFAKRIDYIENFVDYKKIREDADVFDPRYDKSKLILCSCGRMTSVKGFDLAVNAAEILKETGLDFKWYFVGDGPKRRNVETLISEKKLLENIVITGLVDNPYPYIKYCDIYVQPSYEEAHPLSIIEARMLNTVVVATGTVGGKAIVEDGVDGIIADITPNSLADKVVCVVSNKDLRSRIISNLKEKDYSKDYETFCEKWEKLLEE